MNIDNKIREIQTSSHMASSCLDRTEKLKLVIKMYKQIHESLPLFITEFNRFNEFFRTILFKTPHLCYEIAENLSNSEDGRRPDSIQCIQIMMKVQDSVNRILADKKYAILPLPHYMKELEPMVPILDNKTHRKRIARFPTLLGNQASKAYN